MNFIKAMALSLVVLGLAAPVVAQDKEVTVAADADVKPEDVKAEEEVLPVTAEEEVSAVKPEADVAK